MAGLTPTSMAGRPCSSTRTGLLGLPKWVRTPARNSSPVSQLPVTSSPSIPTRSSLARRSPPVRRASAVGQLSSPAARGQRQESQERLATATGVRPLRNSLSRPFGPPTRAANAGRRLFVVVRDSRLIHFPRPQSRRSPIPPRAAPRPPEDAGPIPAASTELVIERPPDPLGNGIRPERPRA